MGTTVLGGGDYSVLFKNDETITAGDGNDRFIVLGAASITAGNGSDTVSVTGAATVSLGNGADSVIVGDGSQVTVGNGASSIVIKGDGTVVAGSGSDFIQVTDNAAVTLGGGNDTVQLGSGSILANGGDNLITFKVNGVGDGYFENTSATGNDTINLGLGNDTIVEAGTATVMQQHFFAATVSGGSLSTAHGQTGHETITAGSGDVTLMGASGVGSHGFEIVGGSGDITAVAGRAGDTFIGGSGDAHFTGSKTRDVMVSGAGDATFTGGLGGDVFRFDGSAVTGSHTILVTDFTQGKDRLQFVNDGLTSKQDLLHNHVTYSGGNAFISLNGGQTVIELVGVTHLTAADIGKFN